MTTCIIGASFIEYQLSIVKTVPFGNSKPGLTPSVGHADTPQVPGMREMMMMATMTSFRFSWMNGWLPKR